MDDDSQLSQSARQQVADALKATVEADLARQAAGDAPTTAFAFSRGMVFSKDPTPFSRGITFSKTGYPQLPRPEEAGLLDTLTDDGALVAFAERLMKLKQARAGGEQSEELAD